MANKIVRGLNGLFGASSAQFSGNDATVEVSAKGLRRVRIMGLAGVNETVASGLSVTETVDSNGFIVVPADGNITITRADTTDSGLKIFVGFLSA